MNTLQSTQQKYLRPEDVYTLIKHFSFTIQQRLEEIQKNNNFYSCLNSQSEKSNLQNYLIHRYYQYKTLDTSQIKLLDRLCDRIIQIFQFYKQKCFQPENFIQIHQKIQNKLRQLMHTSKSYHFFPNARPKTQKIHIKQSMNKNDKTLYVCSSNNNNMNDLIIDQQIISINMPNTKNEAQNKKQKFIDVGELFRYIFSILKKGYLLRLKLQKKKTINSKGTSANINNSQTQNKIAIEGTQAMIRTTSTSQASTKINKKQLNSSNNQENYKERVIDFSRRKTSQFIRKYKLIKDASQNKSQPQKLINTRQIERCLNKLYLPVFQFQKYPLLRSVKDQQTLYKQTLKKNLQISNQIRRYAESYNKRLTLSKTAVNQKQGLVLKQQQQKLEIFKTYQISKSNHTLTQLNTEAHIQRSAQLKNIKSQYQSKQQNPDLLVQLNQKCQEQMLISRQSILIDDKQNCSQLCLEQTQKIGKKWKTQCKQQKDLLSFLQRQNKMNRLSCLQKSKQRKRNALQSNQNRMNITQFESGLNRTQNVQHKIENEVQESFPVVQNQIDQQNQEIPVRRKLTLLSQGKNNGRKQKPNRQKKFLNQDKEVFGKKQRQRRWVKAISFKKQNSVDGLQSRAGTILNLNFGL